MSDTELIKSMKQIHDFISKGKKIKGAKIKIPYEIDTKRIRKKLGMSQKQFADHYQFNFRTLQEWEQGRKVPLPSQQVLLRIIDQEYETVERVLDSQVKFA